MDIKTILTNLSATDNTVRQQAEVMLQQAQAQNLVRIFLSREIFHATWMVFHFSSSPSFFLSKNEKNSIIY